MSKCVLPDFLSFEGVLVVFAGLVAEKQQPHSGPLHYQLYEMILHPKYLQLWPKTQVQPNQHQFIYQHQYSIVSKHTMISFRSGKPSPRVNSRRQILKMRKANTEGNQYLHSYEDPFKYQQLDSSRYSDVKKFKLGQHSCLPNRCPLDDVTVVNPNGDDLYVGNGRKNGKFDQKGTRLYGLAHQQQLLRERYEKKSEWTSSLEVDSSCFSTDARRILHTSDQAMHTPLQQLHPSFYANQKRGQLSSERKQKPKCPIFQKQLQKFTLQYGGWKKKDSQKSRQQNASNRLSQGQFETTNKERDNRVGYGMIKSNRVQTDAENDKLGSEDISHYGACIHTAKKDKFDWQISRLKQISSTLTERYPSGRTHHLAPNMKAQQPYYRRAALTQSKKKESIQTHTIRGTNKVANQDAIKVSSSSQHSVWIVCDGHGEYGHQVSWYVSNLLHELVSDKLRKNRNTINHEQIKQIFLETKNSLERTQIDLNLSGSTCVMVLVVNSEPEHSSLAKNGKKGQHGANKKLICASLGDSTAMIVLAKPPASKNKYQTIHEEDEEQYEDSFQACQSGAKYEVISIEHKPSLASERQRIQFFGGCVKKNPSKEHLPNTPYRIWGTGSDSWGPGLAVSRSFGDKMAQKYGLICEPQITERVLTSNIKHVVMGSDGLFDQVSPEQVSNLLLLQGYSPARKGENKSEMLAEIARKRWAGCADDVSVLLVNM